MLISHSRKFIYLKTRKSGGTSVEIYFEPWCIPPEQKPAGDEREAQSTEWGVVGSRGTVDDPVWFNHMPATRIRELIGEERWRDYFKFCVVRNPFDRVVSLFWFNPSPVLKLLKEADFDEVKRIFTEWIRQAALPNDRSIYTIAGDLAVDDVIEYDRLHTDLERVCKRLGIPWEVTRLARYKSDYRVRREHFSEYYCPETEALVRHQFAWEIDHFGYSCARDTGDA